ncbi:unnamed protein product [Tilletia controversa]|uniref:NADH dehydrogenase [ubiquinone] 1 beta subcomplex subunit 9 n=3 Tax=Tilletia TaxID=13289 RepID=A0A177VDW3_9BASI|nr:hypothetical protein CF335_g9094 [Tilletia laevis]KAE8182412.1 hypothetical protein CF328_g8523 [Tilletia controversa]KAE8257578.1 hypothetical protein A4X03_0g4624 [Tilletia caries]KAE8181767.1 hypothetical protein CF336_g8798 [Tilletia laevis]CAD6884004.1 unnamed protein product [Tilletia caries]
MLRSSLSHVTSLASTDEVELRTDDGEDEEQDGDTALRSSHLLSPTMLPTLARFSAVGAAAAAASSSSTSPAFSQAHKSRVKSLYRRYLKNALDWYVRRDLWRDRAIEIRIEFERNRHIRNPRELARVLKEAEDHLNEIKHPDPYKPALFEDGTKWERNIPPRMFTQAEKNAALEAHH